MLRLCFERAVIDTAKYTDAVTAFISLSINRSSVGCDYIEKKKQTNWSLGLPESQLACRVARLSVSKLLICCFSTAFNFGTLS